MIRFVNKLNSKDSNLLIKCWIEFLMGSAVISWEFFGFNILSDYVKRDYPWCTISFHISLDAEKRKKNRHERAKILWKKPWNCSHIISHLWVNTFQTWSSAYTGYVFLLRPILLRTMYMHAYYTNIQLARMYLCTYMRCACCTYK